MNERCSVCGRFCRPIDQSCPFGTYDSLDPPQEEYYCEQCALKEKEYYISRGWLPSNWRKANWEYEVAQVLDFILITLPGAAWSVWHKGSEQLPDGWIRMGT